MGKAVSWPERLGCGNREAVVCMGKEGECHGCGCGGNQHGVVAAAWPHSQQHPRLVLGWILGAALDHDQCYQLGGKRNHLEVSCHLHGAVAGVSCGHLASNLILSQRTVCG